MLSHPWEPQEVSGSGAQEAEFGDLVFLPAAPKAEQLRWSLAFLQPGAARLSVRLLRQRFQFRWLILVHEATYVNELLLFQTLSRVEQQSENAAERTVIGAWTPKGLVPELVVLTQDVFHLLASPRVVRWLRSEGSYGEALDAWLSPLAVRREQLTGVYTGAAELEIDGP